jgi:hypothetical protein
MQARLSSTPKGSSPRVQATRIRSSPPQQDVAQRATSVASSDEYDDDSESDGDSESESDDDNDNDNDIRAKILNIFAMVEPNGLTKAEIVENDIVEAQANGAS